ncbi:hypothetical protein F4679DRAFT_522766 [Xylaria curta]|nr:hypothetical protein F4679DRAFT_522766 [Xylaria curta]
MLSTLHVPCAIAILPSPCLLKFREISSRKQQISQKSTAHFQPICTRPRRQKIIMPFAKEPRIYGCAQYDGKHEHDCYAGFHTGVTCIPAGNKVLSAHSLSLLVSLFDNPGLPGPVNFAGSLGLGVWICAPVIQEPSILAPWHVLTVPKPQHYMKDRVYPYPMIYHCCYKTVIISCLYQDKSLLIAVLKQLEVITNVLLYRP